MDPIAAISRREKLERPIRYAISDRHLFPDLKPETYLARLAATSATVVQLREKDLERSRLRRLAEAGSRLCRARGRVFLVNSDVQLAIEVGADGVHLPSSGNPEAARQAAVDSGRPDLVMGWSVHDLDEVRAAEESTLDYVLLAPVFSPISKVGRRPLGLAFLREACGISEVPVIALGGITSEQVDAVLKAGAAGFAGISWAAEEIRNAG